MANNPRVITSAAGHGKTNGYRSINAFLYNGSVYQANQGHPEGSHILKIDAIPYDPNFYLFQHHGFVVDGTKIYVTQAPIGENEIIYIIDTETGEVTKGAELVNVEGSHFIGTF